MTEEVQQPLAEVDSAPAAEVTATPEAQVNAPEVAEEAKESRVFTQEELDAAIGKRLAREQRKWEREQSSTSSGSPNAESAATIPPVDQFDSPEDYADALAYQKG
jgi:hypothetical protein